MFVYIMTNKPQGTLYIGVTNNLLRRVYEHRNHMVRGFTNTYNLTRLVWFEVHTEAPVAIQREKSLKRWQRNWKTALIARENPDWQDLWLDILGQPGRGSVI
ncbi:hypothetical protein A8B82_01265 [Sulfitobacter sp. EhC04]|nr:hypothetical protein A8B82_01265 [Sulfitobacter sp. EhC04]